MDPRATEPILDKAQQGDWEFLWATLSALARLRRADDKVAAFLARVPGMLDRMKLPPQQRVILSERVRIARAFLEGPVQQAWMRTARVHEANRSLVEEWREIDRQREEIAKHPPTPPPAPPLEPPAPPAPPSPVARAVAQFLGRLLEYTGVREVRAEQEGILVEVASEADALDLALLLGAQIDGIRLDIRVAP